MDTTIADPRTLLGRWAFTRRIDDRAAGDVKSVAGVITLSAESHEHIRWFEEGTLHLPEADGPAQDLPVTRTMFLVPRDGGWFVVFEDGRDFHPWTVGERVVHPCGADVYDGRIDGGGRSAWTIRWDVTGPQKDYTMITRLRREVLPDAGSGHGV